MSDISFLSQIGVSIGKQNSLPRSLDAGMERIKEDTREMEPSDLSLSPRKNRDSFGLVMRRTLRQRGFTGPPPPSRDLRPPNIQGNEVPKMEGETIKEVVMDLKEGLQLQVQPERSDAGISSENTSDDAIVQAETGENIALNATLQDLINNLLGSMQSQFNSLLTQLTSQLNNMLTQLPAEISGAAQSITGGQFQLIGAAVQFMATPQGITEQLFSLLGLAPQSTESGAEENIAQSLIPATTIEQPAVMAEMTKQSGPMKEGLLARTATYLDEQLFISNTIDEAIQDMATPFKNSQDKQLNTLFKQLADIIPFNSKDILQFDNLPAISTNVIDQQNVPLSTVGFITPDKVPADITVVKGMPVHIPKFIDDVAGKVALGYVRLTAKEGEMVVHLNPPELGRLTVKVVLEDGALKAHFVAPSADVKHLLDQNLATLRQMLEAQGLSINDLLVSLKERHNSNYWSGNNKDEQEVGVCGTVDTIQEKTRYQVVNYSLAVTQVNYLA